MLLSTSKFISTIFKQQLTNISTVLNNTGNTTQLLTSFNALDVAQRKVLLSSKLLTEEQKAQCVTMTALSSANVKYTAEQLAKTTGVSAETLANWGLIKSTDTLTISELAEKAASDAQAKSVLEKIIAQNAQAVANGEVTASNVALATSEKNATLATGTLTTAIKANTVAMLEWLFTNPVGWCILVAGAVYGLSKAYNYLSESEKRMADAHKESVEKVKQSISEYEELEQELETIQQTYDDNEQKLKDLYKLRESQTITQAEQDYLEELEGQNEKLRQQIEYKQTLADINAQEVEDEAVKELNNKTNNDLFNGHSNNGGYTFEYDKITDAEKIKQNSASINALTADLVAYEKVIQGIPLSQEEIDKYTQLLVSYQEQINNIKGESFEDEGKKQGFQSEIDKINKLLNGTLTYEEYEKAVSEVTSSVQSLVTENDTLLQRVEPLNDAIKSTTGENYELKKANDEIIANAKDAAIGFNEYTDSLNGTADALNNVQGSTSDNEITDSFASIFNSSDLKDTKEKLLDLAKAGELTAKALSSDDFKDFSDKLEQIGISSEDAKDEILSLLDATDKLSGASQTISNLEDAYNEFKEKSYVTAETISKIPDTFRELETYDFDLFEKIVGDPKSGTEKIQQAFNDIVTAYINEQGTLLDISEEDSQRFIKNLREMGIVNAEEVVNATIAFKKNMEATADEAEVVAGKINQFLVNTSQSAASATNDLTNCTWAEIQALIEAGNKYGFTTTKIKEYALQKIWANRNSINTSEDVKQLLAVAKACGLAIGYISTFNVSKQLINGVGLLANKSASATDPLLKGLDLGTSKANILNNLLKQIEAEYSFETPEVEWSAPSSSSNKNSSSSDKEKEKTVETYDWIEKLLEKIQNRISRLDKTVSNTYQTWSTRNQSLLQELTEVNTEIIAQQKAYDAYMAKANSVGLSDYYKNLVQNGDYKIEDITDDTLKEQIKSYKEWYEKAVECSDAIVDLKEQMSDLASTQFENLITSYEDQLGNYTHKIEMLESYIDQTESKGYVIGSNYYKQLIATEEQSIQKLNEQYESMKANLQSAIDTGKVKVYSESWYSMVESIRDVQKSIVDANKSLIEYQNSLRDLEWESFDRLQEKISKITEETDFLADLMSENKMFDEDTGAITDQGQATMGLYAINYNTYLTQAEEYAKQLEEINEQIANDPNNNTLIERREELLKLQQDSIKSAQDERQAMKDLAKDGYDALLNAMQKIIDRRKEALNQIKDLYDYEKSISEQTKEISKLEKMINAYQGDDSEEAMSKVQEYKVSLEEAKTNLKESEYDRYIKDQNEMLDSLYSQTEEWINARLDNIDKLIGDIIQYTNENASNINETLKETASNVGYTLSKNLSTAFENASNGVANLVSDYNDNFLETMTTLQSSVDAIRNYITGASDASNKKADENISNTDKPEESLSTPQKKWTQDTNGTWNYYEGGEQVKDSWTKYDKDNKWYHLDNYGNMNTNQWIKNKSGTWSYVDGDGAAVTGWKQLPDSKGRVDWYSFDDQGNMHENKWIDDYFVGKDGRMKTNTWIGHNGKYYWVGADGKWLDKPGWSLDTKPKDGLPIYEYAKGSKRIPEDQLAWTQEKGTEVILRASDGALLTPLGQDDMVFTNEASRKLWEFSQDPEGYMAKFGLSGLKPVEFAMPSISSMMDIPNIDKVSMVQNVSFDFGDIQMYGVNNTEEFAKQLRNTITTDTKTQKLLTEKIGSSFLGRTDRSNFYR